MPEGGAFRFIGERQRYGGSFFTLMTGTFLDPDGFAFEREYVRHPGAVVVVPLEDDGEHLVMVRQYRGSVDQVVLELPAGKLDVPGEAIEAAAARELAEEVGSAASSLVEIGNFYNSPGFTDERTTCFLAEGLTEIGRAADGIEEAHMSLVRVARSEVWNLAEQGQLVDAKSLLAIAFAERVLAARDH